LGLSSSTASACCKFLDEGQGIGEAPDLEGILLEVLLCPKILTDPPDKSLVVGTLVVTNVGSNRLF